MTATTQAEATAVETLELEPRTAHLPAVQQTGAVALADNSPAAMFLRAMERGATAEQIEKMMDLQDRFEAREAEKAYNEAFAAFKAEAVEIIKRKRVHFENKSGGVTDYKHAELSDVVDAATPALSKYGLSTSWKVTKQERDWIEVTCYLKHSRGHFETATLGGPPDQSGGKNAIQAVSSAKTYLERQTMKAVCGLAEKGQDDDGKGGPDVAAVGNSLCDSLLARLEKCATDKEAADLWAEGSRALAEAQRQDLYAEFKDCVIKHRTMLKNRGQE